MKKFAVTVPILFASIIGAILTQPSSVNSSSDDYMYYFFCTVMMSAAFYLLVLVWPDRKIDSKKMNRKTKKSIIGDGNDLGDATNDWNVR